jgi:hypothetical protein
MKNTVLWVVRPVVRKKPDVSEEHIVSTFSAED